MQIAQLLSQLAELDKGAYYVAEADIKCEGKYIASLLIDDKGISIEYFEGEGISKPHSYALNYNFKVGA